MTGLELPGPGRSVFHARFSVSLHLVGRFFSSLMPELFGPRKFGQSAPRAEATTRASIRAIGGSVFGFMAHLEEWWWESDQRLACVLLTVNGPRANHNQLFGRSHENGGAPL